MKLYISLFPDHANVGLSNKYDGTHPTVNLGTLALLECGCRSFLRFLSENGLPVTPFLAGAAGHTFEAFLRGYDIIPGFIVSQSVIHPMEVIELYSTMCLC